MALEREVEGVGEALGERARAQGGAGFESGCGRGHRAPSFGVVTLFLPSDADISAGAR
jgi:hypothetical protein